jgi:hypothetical protein
MVNNLNVTASSEESYFGLLFDPENGRTEMLLKLY